MSSAYFYLHGFASSPNSSKAVFFRQQFARIGIDITIPDLNQGDFFNLTLTRQIQQVAALLPCEQSVTLIGSSLGGLTALWLAEKYPQVQNLVLMAPALHFAERYRVVFGVEKLAAWEKAGKLAVYHYAQQQECELNYAFVRDIHQYQDADLKRHLPTLILHGIHDTVVPIDSSRDYAATHPYMQLHELESDHSLNDVHSRLWTETSKFLDLEGKN